MRVHEKLKDNLSKELRKMYGAKRDKMRISLEEDIFKTWRDYGGVDAAVINELYMAFKYRHWLAHGRYWQLKPGQKKYDYFGVYTIADEVFSRFSLKEMPA